MPFRREGTRLYWAPGESMDWHRVALDHGGWSEQSLFELELAGLLGPAAGQDQQQDAGHDQDQADDLAAADHGSEDQDAEHDQQHTDDAENAHGPDTTPRRSR
jgi:hypothetical protein